jgi:hypothetical protein
MNEKPFWTPPEPEPATEDKSADEPFLRRWSRLKSDRSQEPESPAPTAPAPPPQDVALPAESGAADGEPEADEELPPLEALDENSDFSGFMSPKVSSALRKQALRKLFRSQKFNYICPMDEYNEDFTKFPPLGDIITADMKHAAERLLKKQQEEEEEAAAVAAATADSGRYDARGRRRHRRESGRRPGTGDRHQRG